MIRLLNSLETGTTTGDQLQTLLADTGRQGELTALLNLRSQTKRLASSATAMSAVAGSPTAMTAIGASATATSAVLGSPTANPIIYNATVGVGSFLNECRKRDGLPSDATLAGLTTLSAVAGSSTAMSAVAGSPTAMSAVAGSSTAMSAVVGSSTAMSAVVGSPTAMSAVAGSSTALTALNASDTAMNALYASALIVKVNYGAGWYGETATRTGIGLFVRLTSKGDYTGWIEGSTGNEYVKYDGTAISQSTRNADPYNHTGLTASPRLPMRRFASSMAVRGLNAMEIAYIPLTA